MDKLLQDVFGAIVGSAVLGGAGLLVTWGMVRQMVKGHEERIEKAENRIERLQDEQRQVPALSVAIEHMGDKFATAIQNLADRFGDQHGRVQAELDELKSDLKRTRTRRQVASGRNN